MKPAPSHTFIVAARRRRTRERWALAILHPGGRAETLTASCSRRTAIETAGILAGNTGRVRVYA